MSVKLLYTCWLSLCSIVAYSFQYSPNLKIIEADSLVEIEEYEKANAIYETVLINKAHETYRSIDIATKLAISYQKLKQHQKAIDLLKPLLSESLADQDSITALAHHKLAVSHYYLLQDDQAIHSWQEAIDIRELILPANHDDIIKGYRNIGTTYLNLEDYGEAKRSLSKALDLLLSRKDKDDVLIAKTYAELGHTLSVLGDYGQAEVYLLEAESLYESLFQDEPWEISLIYSYQYEYYHGIGNLTKSILYPQKIINLVTTFDELYQEDSLSLADAYNNLSNGYQLSGMWDKSIHSLNKSIALNESLGQDRSTQLATNYSNLSIAYLNTNEIDLAHQAVDQAININQKNEDPLSLSVNYINKSDVLRTQNQISDALESSDKALQQLGITSQNQDAALTSPVMIDAYLSKIKALLQGANSDNHNDYTDETMQTISAALQGYDKIRESYINEESRRILSGHIKEIINLGLKFYHDQYLNHQNTDYIQAALDLSEKSKSINLLEALQDATRSNQDSDINRKLSKLKKEISDLEKARFFKTSEEVDSDLIEARRHLEVLQDSIKSIDIDKAAAGTTSSIRISHITDIIEDHCIVDYHISEYEIYVFLLKDGHSIFESIEKPKDLKSMIKSYREGIYYPKLNRVTKDSEIDHYDSMYVDNAIALQELLIEPISKHLSTGDELIIIPDGELGYIPFDALITEKAEVNYLFDQHHYLVKDYDISYSYSIGLYLEMSSRKNNPTKSCIAMAPLFAGELSQDRSFTLAKLEHNETEAQAIISIMGGDAIVNTSATESVFRQEASNYSVIHLATHGKANDLAGDYAYLAFSAIQDSIENEFLYNAELYNLKLNADLVVLSACETGVGELNKGEGIISLARGFSYAGAKSIITTLWSINDARTKEIMESFYHFIKKGKAKDSALREAKLEFIEKNKRNAHPFYWAAFIPIGDMEPIIMQNGLSKTLVLSTGLVFFIFLILFLWYRLTRSK